MDLDIQSIIDDEHYEGIRDQDGWETLELTVRDNHPTALANTILSWLEVPRTPLAQAVDS